MPFVVARSLEEWAQPAGAGEPRLHQGEPSAVVTVGNFDGLHLGHQKILRRVVERARESAALTPAKSGLAAAVTFDPHPVKILRPAEAPPLITTLPQRLRGLEDAGLDAVLVVNFDLEFSQLSPEEFVRVILCEGLHAAAVVVGENFRFGSQQAGDVRLLTRLGRQLGFAVEVVPPVVVRGEQVSSTAIRGAVGEGRVHAAARLLGRTFALSGKIIPGTGQGRRLVFPTLNLDYEQELLPAIGVYATETIVAGRRYRSATNLGIRPTFGSTALPSTPLGTGTTGNGSRLTVESHLFDFSETMTSGPMEVQFWERLRDEHKFSGPEELKQQIHRDIEQAREIFRRVDATRKSKQMA